MSLVSLDLMDSRFRWKGGRKRPGDVRPGTVLEAISKSCAYGLVLSIPMPAFRAVQGEVTADPALHVYAHGEACRPDEGRIDIGAGCPLLSMVRESYGCIIGDAPTGGAPVW